MATTQSPTYPIINFTKQNLHQGSESWLNTCRNVRQAFEEHGFFVAVQEGLVSTEFSNGMFQELEKLFSLPEEIKKQNTSDIVVYLGYQAPSTQMPLSESLSIQDSTKPEAVQQFTSLMWPSGNKNFFEAVNLYTTKTSELRRTLSKMLLESYGLGKNDHEDEHFTHILRFNKYWPPDSQELEIGAFAHTDKNAFTMLHQINQVNGLQIKLKGTDHWTTIEPPPQSLVVFAGAALSGWSNGRIHAPVHRVMMQGEEVRHSIAQFAYFRNLVHVPKELVDGDHPLCYKPFDNFGLLRFFATEEGQKADDLLKAYCGV